MTSVLALIYIGIGFGVGVLTMVPYTAGNWQGWRRAIPYIACVVAGGVLVLTTSLPLWVLMDRIWGAI